MKKIVTLLVLVSAVVFPQNQYLVFFTDKGIEPDTELTPEMKQYKDAVNALSERSVERRKKHLGEKFVNYDDVPVTDNYIKEIEDKGVNVFYTLKWPNAAAVEATDSTIELIEDLDFVESVRLMKTVRTAAPVEELRAVDVDAVQPDRSTRPEKVKNAPEEKSEPEADPNLDRTIPSSAIDYGSSYTHLNLSGVTNVHNIGITGEDVLIGIMDTGFDWEFHNSLKKADVKAEYDFIFRDTVTADQPEDNKGQDGHGTFALSIIGAFENGSMIGAAYNASFALVKSEDDRSETFAEEVYYAKGLEWLDSVGVDISTSSLAYNNFDDFSYDYEDLDGESIFITKALDKAFDRGIITITAAGNEGNDPWFYIAAPSDAINCITVGAVDSYNQIASFSSRGPTSDGRIKPEVVAQGVSVYGATSGTRNRYRYSNGTSFSTPIVAGCAALLLDAHPHLLNTQVKHILMETADTFNKPDNVRGYGLVNVLDAVTFPNIEEIDGKYIIHKLLEDPNAEDPVMFMKNDNFLADIDLSENTEGTWTAPLPDGLDEEIEIYFTWDVDGKEVRYPYDKKEILTWLPGELNICRITK